MRKQYKRKMKHQKKNNNRKKNTQNKFVGFSYYLWLFTIFQQFPFMVY